MRKGVLGAFLALGAMLLMAPAAVAAPKKVTPVASISSAAKSGKQIKFTIDIVLASFAVTHPLSDCKGKITVATKLSKRKSIKWTGSLKPDALSCKATIKAALPVASYGKKVKFSYFFKGTKSIKAFDKSVKLVLTAPPVVTTPDPAQPGPSGPPVAINHNFAYGNWATDPPATGAASVFSFAFASDYSMHAFNQSGGSFRWNCANSGSPTPQNTSGLVFFDTDFIVGSDSVSGTSHYELINGATMERSVDYSLSITFTGQLAGHGTFTANGTWTYPVEDSPGSGTYHPELFSCERTVTFTTYHYGATGL